MQTNSNNITKKKPKTLETLSDDSLQLESWLPYHLFRISGRIADVLDTFYGPRFGLSRSAWRTMAIIANRPALSVKEICQTSGLDQFSVSRAIRQLVEFGFAEREAGRSDKRYAAVELSKAGHAVFGEISVLAKQLEAELVASVTAGELVVLNSVLSKLDNTSAGILARSWRGISDEGD